MEKSFYSSMTFWGCCCLVVSGGLGALGAWDTVAVIAGVVGIPLTGFGIRRALD